MIKDVLIYKRMASVALASTLFIGGISPVIADDTSMDAIKKELRHLGEYLGYDLKAAPVSAPDSSIDASGIETFQSSAIKLLLSTLPGTSIVSPDPNSLNTLINAVFNSQTPSGTPALDTSHLFDMMALQPSASGGTSSGANPTIGYAADPVTQGIINILATPSQSLCAAVTANSNSTSTNNPTIMNCSLKSPLKTWLYQESIPYTVLGGVPLLSNIQSIGTDLTDQLNSNSLITPLIYSVTGSQQSTGNSQGLSATNQAQLAQNFIRYASSAVVPPAAISTEMYNQLTNTFTSQSSTPTQQLSALSSLTSYFVNMRSYAAQLSIGTGNLYNMLAKRLPQTDSNGGTTSEAYNEYLMATHRLFNPAAATAATAATTATAAASGSSGTTVQTPNQLWIDKINGDSPAAVEKEIAILLSEINYQLYLSRRQDERLLLTNTAILFQLSHVVAPKAPPPSPTANSTSTNTSGGSS